MRLAPPPRRQAGLARRPLLHASALAALALTVWGCGGCASVPSDKPATAQSAHRQHARSKGELPTLRTPPGRPLTAPQHVQVPILMYHVIKSAPPGTPYPELWVDPALFARQMHALARAGYTAVTLGRVWGAWQGREAVPRHPLVVSFDDGYLSQYTNAAHTLRALGWPGVLNLELHNVGKDGLPRHLVRRMIAAGWEIDAHTISHPDLTTLDAKQLRREVAGSRAALRQIFGVPVAFFCYPAGRFDARVEAAVRAAGYRAATTTQSGLADESLDPMALPRIRVDAGESPATLLAAVRTAHVRQPAPTGAGGE